MKRVYVKPAIKLEEEIRFETAPPSSPGNGNGNGPKKPPGPPSFICNRAFPASR